MKTTLKNLALISGLILAVNSFAQDKCKLTTTIQFDPAFIEGMAKNLKDPAYLQWIGVDLLHGQNPDAYNDLLFMPVGSKEPLLAQIPQHTLLLRKDGENVIVYWVKDNQVISKPLDFTQHFPDDLPVNIRQQMQNNQDQFMKNLFSFFPDNGSAQNLDKKNKQDLLNIVLSQCGCNLWKENDYMSELSPQKDFSSTQHTFPSDPITTTASVDCGSTYKIRLVYQAYYWGRDGKFSKPITVDKDITQTLFYPKDF